MCVRVLFALWFSAFFYGAVGTGGGVCCSPGHLFLSESTVDGESSTRVFPGDCCDRFCSRFEGMERCGGCLCTLLTLWRLRVANDGLLLFFGRSNGADGYA